jgi:HK97 family phage prohead protease
MSTAVAIEKRSINVELRATEESRTVTGVASVFNQWTEIGSWFREMIAESAFDECLNRGDDVRALLNHDPNHLLARTKSGTLTLRKGPTGLEFEFEMPASRDDLLESIRRGDLGDCSFQFSMRDGEETWRYNSEDGMDERIITRVGKLYDIALVTFPAYEGTSIDLRYGNIESYNDWKASRDKKDDVEYIYEGRLYRERQILLNSF